MAIVLPTDRIDKKRMRLFLYMGGAYFLLAVINILFSSGDNFMVQFVNHVWHLAFLVVIHFILLEYIFGFFKLSWKRIILFIPVLFVFMLVYGFGHLAWVKLGEVLGIFTPRVPNSSWEQETEYLMAYSMGSLAFFVIVRHMYDFRNLRLTAQRLQIEKQAAELNYLKAQTNPHFLFNTLNNIYSLARDKSDLTAESIMRLSKILRFMLYETRDSYIALEQELKVIEDFVELEKLRYNHTLQVDFNCELEDVKQAVPPLILMPLVENAFKHGASETRKNPFVDIRLAVKDSRLSFMVSNSVENQGSGGCVKENIGLSNLRRQLELLYSDYELNLKQNDGVFTAHLKIILASHVQY